MKVNHGAKEPKPTQGEGGGERGRGTEELVAPSVGGQGGAGGTQSSRRIETVVTPRASWRVTLTKAPWALRRVGRLAARQDPGPVSLAVSSLVVCRPWDTSQVHRGRDF